MFKKASFLAILPILLVMGACTPISQTASKSWTNNTLARQSYEAIDMMIKQKPAPIGTAVLVGTLSDINELETSSAFGRIVAEQISTRLTQRGYVVSELKMRNNVNIKRGLYNGEEGGEFLLSRDINQIDREQKASAIVTGTYAVANNRVMVNLKMLDVVTGQIIAATDYKIDNNGDIKALLNSNSSGFNFYGSSIAY